MTVLCLMKGFSSTNITASILLFVTAIAAAVIASSPAAPVYQGFLSHELHFHIGGFNLFSHVGHNLTTIEFIDDELMTTFLLMAGLEIKRGLLVGEPPLFRKATLPFIVVCSGTIVPAVIYSVICTPGTGGGQRLAIPTTTDIAFSLGVLSLLDRCVPLSLKIFLTVFAVVDDIGGILVITTFYGSHVAYEYLLWAVLLHILLYFIGKKGVASRISFLVVGVVIWYLLLQSDIHSTVSGAVLIFVIPAKPQSNAGAYIEHIRHITSTFPEMRANNIVLANQRVAKLREVEPASDRVISSFQSLEDNLYGTVNYLVLPLLALANAGVMFNGEGGVTGEVTYAVALGLLTDKFPGTYSFTWLVIKSGLTPMPLGMSWENISEVALPGGISFTVSLFIANLLFDSTYPVLLNRAKFGVLSGMVIAGTLGYLILHWVLPRKR